MRKKEMWIVIAVCAAGLWLFVMVASKTYEIGYSIERGEFEFYEMKSK